MTRLRERLVRPHDLAIGTDPGDGVIEAMVRRTMHLGFEVRIELAPVSV